MIFAKVIMAVSILQSIIFILCRYYNVGSVPPSLVYGSIANSMGSIVQALGYPSRPTAFRLSMAIHAIGFALFGRVIWEAGFVGISRGFFPDAGREYLLALGCSSKTRTHHGPGADMTLEVWARGRWCKTKRQQLTRVTKVMQKHREGIEAERCFTACMYQLAADGERWHGFVSSAPAGQLPGKEYCSAGYYFGNCPQHELYWPVRNGIGFEEVGSMLVLAPM